jgi:PadR family transcriptional regulator PadR
MPTAEELFGSDRPNEIELGLLQMQLLWLISKRDIHGYELMKELETIKGKKITQGTLYPTLQKLEKYGYIKGHFEDNRVVYKITQKGRTILNETSTDFIKTFFGIFHDFACKRCIGHDHARKTDE